MTASLVTAFRFEVSLIRAATVSAGSQRLLGHGEADAPPVGLDTLGNGGFQEVSGLEVEMDVQDYQEGGRNNGVIRRAGRAKFQPLVLKRGMFFGAEGGGAPTPEGAAAAAGSLANADLWRWIQGIVNGERPIPRYDGIIYVKSAEGTVRATWVFERGLPARIKGPELNARNGEIAIEELHVAHEGLRLLMPDAAAA